MSLEFSNQDSSLEDVKVKKENRPSSSHPSTRSGTIQTKKNLATTYQSQEKYSITDSGKVVGTPSTGSIYPERQRTTILANQIHAVIVHSVIVYRSVPSDRIYKVISQKGERTLFERLSTPRPAPEIVLMGAWQPQQQQQQQQDTSESASSSTEHLETDAGCYMLRKKSLKFKSTSELNELHKM